MKKYKISIFILFLFVNLQNAFCEDKGDTEKFIGMWKVESYIVNGKQYINDSNWISGTIRIKKEFTYFSNSMGGDFIASNVEEIFYLTEEKWVSFKGWEMKEKGMVRFEKGSTIKLNIFSNMYVRGIYEINGSKLMIRGVETGGGEKLYQILLTRYSDGF